MIECPACDGRGVRRVFVFELVRILGRRRRAFWYNKAPCPLCTGMQRVALLPGVTMAVLERTIAELEESNFDLVTVDAGDNRIIVVPRKKLLRALRTALALQVDEPKARVTIDGVADPELHELDTPDATSPVFLSGNAKLAGPVARMVKELRELRAANNAMRFALDEVEALTRMPGLPHVSKEALTLALAAKEE